MWLSIVIFRRLVKESRARGYQYGLFSVIHRLLTGCPQCYPLSGRTVCGCKNDNPRLYKNMYMVIQKYVHGYTAVIYRIYSGYPQSYYQNMFHVKQTNRF